MISEYIYLIPFKPERFKKNEALNEVAEHERVRLEYFTKSYHGIRVNTEKELDCDWIANALSKYGEVGNIQKYSKTSDIMDFQSRPLTNQEAEEFEKDLRKDIKSGSIFWVIVFAGLAYLSIKNVVSYGEIYWSIPSAIFVIFCILCIKWAIDSRKEAKTMKLSQNDWVVMEPICCTTWSKTKIDTAYEVDDPNNCRTYYYCNFASGNVYLNRTFECGMEIGETKKLYYNVKNEEINFRE